MRTVNRNAIFRQAQTRQRDDHQLALQMQQQEMATAGIPPQSCEFFYEVSSIYHY